MTCPRTELVDFHGAVVGVVSLENAVATLEPGARLHGDFLDGLNVLAPGPTLVQPDEGTRYLASLPFALRGPYLTARYLST
jgi:hypothetical protein